MITEIKLLDSLVKPLSKIKRSDFEVTPTGFTSFIVTSFFAYSTSAFFCFLTNNFKNPLKNLGALMQTIVISNLLNLLALYYEVEKYFVKNAFRFYCLAL